MHLYFGMKRYLCKEADNGESSSVQQDLHRAKSEISYVFYVDDRCRIGLIHMSATNPIEEI